MFSGTWQHYDEPAHFEYAWLIANRPGGLPLRGEFDQPLRRALAASMIEHDFFRGMALLPDLEASNEAVWIGVSQVGDPPLYYLLASLPLRFLSTSDVTLQLYAARFVSLGLYLLSILCAWGMLQELVSNDHILLDGAAQPGPAAGLYRPDDLGQQRCRRGRAFLPVPVG
jgi:hypothetical protein